jgi:uncharacterized protein DUF5719
MSASRMLPRAGVVLALAAAGGLAVWNHTVTVAAGQPVPQPRAVPASTVLRACPAPGLTGSPAAHLAVIAGPASAGSGRTVVTYSGATSGTPLVSLTQPGVLSLTRVRSIPAPAPTKTAHTKTTHKEATSTKSPSPASTPSPSPTPSSQPVTTVPAAGGVVIRASGSMARGLEAEQVAGGTGKVAARCDGPGTDFWFSGPGVFTAPRIYLYLMNPGSESADVSVQAFTDAGPLMGSTDTGISVAPHAMVVQSLGKMLHGARAMALHVRTSVGQIVAAVEQFTGSARTGAWLPASAPPAKQTFLPGMPPTAGTRQLFVTVPGTQDAHITLKAITTKGTYEPTGGSSLDIPSGSVAVLSLPSLSAIPGAVEVSSSEPVTAAMLVPGGAGTFTAGASAIQEQGVVADNVTGGGLATALVLSAPGRAVQARVTQIAEGSSAQAATSKVFQVPAHHSVVEELGRAPGSRKGTAFAVIVTPLAGSGPLYAGRVITGSGKGGVLQSILAVPSALGTVPLPGVRNALISP